MTHGSETHQAHDLRGANLQRGVGKAYLVGGGIASMAAAVFLIRDGDMLGQDITIIEELDRVGGSLDGAGSPEDGYVLRGGRMLESKYVCTFGLFSSIPTLDGRQTVTQEIFDWNGTMQTSSKARLVRAGQRQIAPAFGLSEKHIMTIARLALEPEGLIGTTAIAHHFDAPFFKTNFWIMWCTTFAFQPWHSAVEFKRYLLRFSHMIGGFNRLQGIMRTVYNQYDSLVLPLRKWLDGRGVRFERGTRVTDLDLSDWDGEKTVRRILVKRGGEHDEIAVDADDIVLVTLGSMTEGSSLGTMDTAPVEHGKAFGGAWSLWERIAAKSPEFGNPSTFSDHVYQSRWVSFTLTLHDPSLLRLIQDLTGNVAGEGGLITFAESHWLASIVVPHQPHFIGQPDNVGVVWGYGLSVDRPGNFVMKPMSACSGREIMVEVLGHLGLSSYAAGIIDKAVCIPCMMPFITSQFLPRHEGDRPRVKPQGLTNLAFAGQFCELPDDVVFTVEYSIRSAQTAAYALLNLDRKPPPVYKGQHDLRVLLRAFYALQDVDAKDDVSTAEVTV